MFPLLLLLSSFPFIFLYIFIREKTIKTPTNPLLAVSSENKRHEKNPETARGWFVFHLQNEFIRKKEHPVKKRKKKKKMRKR